MRLRPVARGVGLVALLAWLGACAEGTQREPLRPEAPTFVPAPQAAATAPAPPVAGNAEARPLLRPSIDRGTGVFVGRPAEARARVHVDAAGEVILNFVEADIREVVRSILADTLEVPYVVDPRVAGTITVETARPLPQAAVLPLLDSVLRLNGAALIERDGLFQIVPLGEALAAGAAPGLRPPPSARAVGFSVQVVPLRFVSAEEMRRILEPFQPPGGTIAADPARNALVLAGTQGQLGTLVDLVDIFDVDWLQGMSFGLFPLRSAAAGTIVEELRQAFSAEAEEPLGARVRFIPIERLNAVLVVTPQPAWLERIQAWIERLDRGGEEEGRRLYVYYVENKRAADLADVLQQVFAPEVRPPEIRLAPGLIPAEIRAPPLEPEAGLEPLELPALPRMGNPDGVPAPRLGIAFAPSVDVRIIADEPNNALVVLATPREWRMIEAALSRLDILPLQVLIEATIAEVSLSDELRYGLQWFFKFGTSELLLTQVTELAPGATIPTGAVARAFPGFSYLFTSSDDVRVVLNALESVTDVNVVSSPQLLVLGNQTARLQVGDQVPVVVREAISVIDPDAPIARTIELRDTGVILDVTPRVNPGGLTVLEISQEVSSVVPTVTSGIDSPTIRQRRITSSVAIQSGETVALGGLIQDDRERGQSGVPVLSRIPILGPLFGARTTANRRTELLVLLTPRVIRSPDEARQVTDELRMRLRAVEPLGLRLR